MKVIYFAGGCFWGTEHFFSGVTGVLGAVSGYAQGNPSFEGRPSYEQVYTDTTGFAETVRVEYDPQRISLETLTDLFFSIIDPLSLNRQGHDEGTRYRTGVYYEDAADLPVLKAAFAVAEARIGQPVVVELEPLRNFFEAEERHQKYLDKNPDGYCHLPLKTFKYLRLYQDVAALLGDETDTVARMAESAALIYERMHFLWVGYYRVCGDELVLGPFQGPPACVRIPFGKGVCGTAWKEARTIVVPDVEEFPGHIACNSLSRSEIVVPVFAPAPDLVSVGASSAVRSSSTDRSSDAVRSGQPSASVIAVLDIDSASIGTFDSTDALWLGKIVSVSAVTS